MNQNKIFYPINENISIGYFNNSNSSFIIDEKNSDKVFNHFWTAKFDKDRCTPLATIDGKHTYLSRFIMNTQSNEECDHENGVTLDNRECNLRNCSKTKNLYNRKCSAGDVYQESTMWKVRFPKENVNDITFDTKDEAIEFLYKLNEKYYGDFSYYKSQKNGIEKSSHYFDNDIYFLDDLLKEISILPCANIYKIILDETIRKLKLNIFTEETANKWLLKLINDYKHQE